MDKQRNSVVTQEMQKSGHIEDKVKGSDYLLAGVKLRTKSAKSLFSVMD